jgi:hypothetical protein
MGDVRFVYYGALAAFALWGMATIGLAAPLVLVKLAAVIAAFNYAVLATHTLVVVRTLLPPLLRPAWWRQGALAFMALFYGTLTALGLATQLLGVRF